MPNTAQTPTGRMANQPHHMRVVIARLMAADGQGVEDIMRRCHLERAEAQGIVMGPKN